MERIFKITRYCDGMGNDLGLATVRQPMWAIRDNSGDSEFVLMCPLRPDRVNTTCTLLQRLDRFVEVPVEEWPDEVCRVMALRAMGVDDA